MAGSNVPARFGGSVLFFSNLEATISVHEELAEEVLRETGAIVEKKAKENTKDGFKSGEWQSDPPKYRHITHEFMGEGEDMEVRVGMPKGPNESRLHYAFWEHGHFNIYTNQYEQEQWLSNAVKEAREEMQLAAFNKAAEKMATVRIEKRVKEFAQGFSAFTALELVM